MRLVYVVHKHTKKHQSKATDAYLVTECETISNNIVQNLNTRQIVMLN